ncbi:hypothetical protein BGX34_011732 [Mortierella sp. NVP85]|nr:hypothetical protein BGX34_011732 [Mortierella sp. NVP85]
MEAAGATSIPMTPSTTPSAPVLTASTAETIHGNIKEMKTRVLDFNKAKVLFDAREKEITRLNQELAKAQKTIEALQSESNNRPTRNQGDDELRLLLATRTQEWEAAKADSTQASLRQKDAEERLAKQLQKLKAAEMLKQQLEAKTTDQDKLLQRLKDQLKEQQKQLDASSRRSKQEVTELKESLMKAKAEKANRQEWLQEQKKLWEEQKKQESQKQKEKVSELEQQLEDAHTEHLENEMTKEQLRNATDNLQKTASKLVDANNKILSLNQGIMELQAKNADLERRLGSQNSNDMNESEVTEEFEEVDTTRAIVPSSSSRRLRLASPPTRRPTETRAVLSTDELEGALRAIEGLKNQLQIHHTLSESNSGKQKITALSEQVRVLTEEKRALQDEVTRLLIQVRQGRRQSPPKNIQEQSSKGQPVQQALNRNENEPRTILGLTGASPTNADVPQTTPNPSVPAKRGRKRKADIEQPATPVLAIPVSTGRPRQTRLPLLKKTRMAKKAANAKASEVDFSSIKIRNISVNPIIPDISNPLQYFTCMMHSAFTQDKLAIMKLNTLASILPDKLDNLFEAVQVKAKEIAPGVAAFCKDNEMIEDGEETWVLQGYEAIKISTSLSPSENYIVQAVCILQARFPEVSFGFSTLTERCKWPSIHNVPHIDSVVEEIMEVVRAPDFMTICRQHPRYAFALRKALELLFVQGFDWSEFYTNFLRPELFKEIVDESRYMFFMPLVAAVARDYRYRSKPSPIDNSALKMFLEAVLFSQAKVEHQKEAALAIVMISDGQENSVGKVKEWLHQLDKEQKSALPQQLVAVIG